MSFCTSFESCRNILHRTELFKFAKLVFLWHTSSQLPLGDEINVGSECGEPLAAGRKRRRSSAKNSDLMLMVMDFGRRPDWGSPIDIAKQWKKEPVSRYLPAPVCESIVQRQQQQQQQNSQNCSFFHCLDIAHFLRRKRLLLRRQFYQAIPTSIFFNVPNKAFIYCRLPSGNESRTFVTGGVSIWSQFVAAKKHPHIMI